MAGRGAAVGALLLVALLGGCGGDPPVGTLPTESSTAISLTPTTSAATTTSTVATPTGPPTVPAEAMQHTPDGAAAFVRLWFDTLQYSWSVMDSAPLRALGNCLTCAAFGDTIDSVASRGNRLEGADTTILSIAPNSVQGDGAGTVVALFSATEQREVTATGDTVDVIDAGVDQLQFFFDLGWQNTAWRVTAIRTIE